MKLLLLSDLHLMWDRPRCRLDDDMARTCLNKMKFVLEYASRENCVILQAGDFFDKPRSWHLLVAYMRLLDEYGNVPVYCVFGQHDQYYRTREDTLLVALSIAGRIKILGKEPEYFLHEERKVCIYGCGYGEGVPEVNGSSDCDILVAHRTVIAKRMWPGQEDYELADRFLRKYDDYDLVLCGDAHEKFEVSIEQADERCRIICNTGPMVRKSVDLWKHEPGFFVYDTKDWMMDWVDMPHEPSEKCMSRKHIEDAEESSGMLRDFVEAVDEEVEAGDSFDDNLDRFVMQNNIESEIVGLISEEMSKNAD